MPDKLLRSLSLALAITLSVRVLFWPGGDGPLPFPQADKVVHTLTFALLAITAWWRFARPRAIYFCLAVYAIASEIIQHWIPRRSFDLVDIAADLAGAFVILLAVRKRT